MPPAAVRGNRGVQRGSGPTGPELGFGLGDELGGENGRACLDRGWVKMTIAVVVTASDGTAHSRDSRG